MFVIIECKDKHLTAQFKIDKTLSMIDCVYDLTIATTIFFRTVYQVFIFSSYLLDT